MSINLTDFIWTFGNHEPLDMYQRIGKHSTGGVTGGALWLEKWHHWYDSEECAAAMADLGLSILHCRFYKGLGLQRELKDFERVKPFARACRARGIKVLAYIQYASLYPEIMRAEIPDLADWAARDYHGNFIPYAHSYWRWLPCPTSTAFADYLSKVLDVALDSGEFDGVMYDNVFTSVCYCPRCRRAFVEHLKKCNFDFLIPEFVEMPPPDLGMPEAMNELTDPVRREFLVFQQIMLESFFTRLREQAKRRNPDFILTANYSMAAGRYCYQRGINQAALSRCFDFTLAQSGNEPEVRDGMVISQTHELKFGPAAGTQVVPLNDADAAGAADAGPRYVSALFESLFGGTTPVDRVVMRPKRGGDLDLPLREARRPVLAKLRQTAKKYADLLHLPNYEPVGLLYSVSSIFLSQTALYDFMRAEESLMRNNIPYRLVVAERDAVTTPEWRNCETLILCGARCLSDAVVEELLNFSGQLVLIGDRNGDFDADYRERAANPFAAAPAKRMKTIPPHEVLSTGWNSRVRFVADDWKMRFPTAVSPILPPEASTVIKLKSNRVAAVLITAPAAVHGAKIHIAPPWRNTSYHAETVTAEHIPVPIVGDELILPEFSGMLMVIAD